MRPSHPVVLLASAAAIVGGLAACAAVQPPHPMGFFVTSANPGRGADFGGLAGADRHCQALASTVGAGGRVWRAYLSTTGPQPVHARDRIGRGPWKNANGEVIASSVDELHGAASGLTKRTALTERAEPVSGRGDPVNTHDILTGSTPEGRAATTAEDTTCRNWTSGADGSAIVGHHDRMGLRDDAPSKSWNSSHATRGCGAGCAQDDRRQRTFVLLRRRLSGPA